MLDLSTVYLGQTLKNPIVASSSSLTNTPEKVKKLEDAGVGAVSLRSIFEEEIEGEIEGLERQVEHTEAWDYIRSAEMSHGLDDYRRLIRGCKEAVSIPVFASMNAKSSSFWVDHVKVLEDAGADGIELNLSLLPVDHHDTEDKIIQFYVDTVKQVKQRISVPLAVKIGYYFTSIPSLVDKLHFAGATGVVMFNRFYQVDIDTNSERLGRMSPISSPTDYSIPMRWVMLCYGKTEIDLATSSGVHDGETVVKMLLAGATVTQVCSALLKNGVEYAETMRTELESWMRQKGYSSIDQFRGKLSQKHSKRPKSFERLQYVKTVAAHA